MKKIIFLDIDGVMNNEVMYELNPAYQQKRNEIDPKCIKHLNDLIKDTSAEVVISSVWRYNMDIEALQTIFNNEGFIGKIIDKTPVLRSEYTVRGNEILAWIKNNEELLGQPYYNFRNYVIFDDDSDMLYWQKDNFICVDSYSGLTARNVYKATYILNSTYMER